MHPGFIKMKIQVLVLEEDGRSGKLLQTVAELAVALS